MSSKQSKFQLLFEAAPDAIIIVDKEGKITLVNGQAEKCFGYTREELIGEYIEIVVPEQFRRTHITQRLTYMEHPDMRPMGRGIDLTAQRKDGSIFPVDISLSPLETDNDGLLIMSIIRDVTEHRVLEKKLQYLAEHDVLTGLINRSMFKDRVTHAIALSKRNQQHMALFFIDLDGFKEINDAKGHAVGDALLQVVANRLLQNLRESDSIARIGGDEFVMLLAEIKQSKIVYEMADKILSFFKEPFHLEGDGDINVTASIGVAVYPHDGDNYEALLKKADLAMYDAKKQGKNICKFADPSF
ncbi:MAG: diguanylate cyclase [Gammaproteobacteria bacterium]|nr:diguanylate cyclase [Gammaproteobacteria bacterium]